MTRRLHPRARDAYIEVPIFGTAQCCYSRTGVTTQVNLVPRFPPYYDIFNRFVDDYHTRLFQMVEEMKTGDSIDPAEIMSLLQWVPT